MMHLIQIPAIQDQIREWERKIVADQAEHWRMQKRGVFNQNHLDKVTAFRSDPERVAKYYEERNRKEGLCE